MSRQAESVGAGVARNHVATELWVEHAQFVERHIQHLANLVEVDALAHGDGVGEQRLLCQTWADIVILKVSHYVVGCDECGHIATSFLRQIRVYLPKVFARAPSAAKRLVHVARTAVVGGNHKRPVVIDVVEALEVGGSRSRRAIWVAAFVHHAVHLKA